MAIAAAHPTSDTAPIDAEALETLRSDFRGPLLQPGDESYDAARQIWNAMIDHRPALIAQCTGVVDVMRAVDFAHAHELLLAVRGGGHNVAGNAVCDGGLMLDLSLMKGIRVDPMERTVRAEGGVTWGELDRETQALGLATTGGTVSSTGIAGLTLGGGFGWLMRRHGLACDNLLAADIVTADGRLVYASADENADLFWGLRGGGGNFGVVTSFEFRLHEVGPTVLSGPIFHPIEVARDLFRFFGEVGPTLPETVGCMAALVTSPEGIPLAALFPVYAGPLDRGEDALRPLRQFGSPIADLVAPTPYRTAQTMFDAAFPAGLRNYWKSSFLRGLDDAAIAVMADHFRRVPSPHAGIAIELFGGAVGSGRDGLRPSHVALRRHHLLRLGRPGVRSGQHQLGAGVVAGIAALRHRCRLRQLSRGLARRRQRPRPLRIWRRRLPATGNAETEVRSNEPLQHESEHRAGLTRPIVPGHDRGGRFRLQLPIRRCWTGDLGQQWRISTWR
jgi:hypothetical protein